MKRELHSRKFRQSCLMLLWGFASFVGLWSQPNQAEACSCLGPRPDFVTRGKIVPEGTQGVVWRAFYTIRTFPKDHSVTVWRWQGKKKSQVKWKWKRLKGSEDLLLSVVGGFKAGNRYRFEVKGKRDKTPKALELLVKGKMPKKTKLSLKVAPPAQGMLSFAGGAACSYLRFVSYARVRLQWPKSWWRWKGLLRVKTFVNGKPWRHRSRLCGGYFQSWNAHSFGRETVVASCRKGQRSVKLNVRQRVWLAGTDWSVTTPKQQVEFRCGLFEIRKALPKLMAKSHKVPRLSHNSPEMLVTAWLSKASEAKAKRWINEVAAQFVSPKLETRETASKIASYQGRYRPKRYLITLALLQYLKQPKYRKYHPRILRTLAGLGAQAGTAYKTIEGMLGSKNKALLVEAVRATLSINGPLSELNENHTKAWLACLRAKKKDVRTRAIGALLLSLSGNRVAYRKRVLQKLPADVATLVATQLVKKIDYNGTRRMVLGMLAARVPKVTKTLIATLLATDKQLTEKRIDVANRIVLILSILGYDKKGHKQLLPQIKRYLASGIPQLADSAASYSYRLVTYPKSKQLIPILRNTAKRHTHLSAKINDLIRKLSQAK